MQEKKLSVLIIEDEPVFRHLAMQVFDGFERTSAATASDGLAKFKELCPDITLLDIGLPDKSGLDLLPELINYDPEAFVIMLTISSVSRDVKLSKERGAAGYILKPFTFSKVSDCIIKYREHKKKLQAMTPDERASNIVGNLKIAAPYKDIDALGEHLQENAAEPKKTPQEDPGKILQKETPLSILMKSWKILFADNYLINREHALIQLSKLGSHIDLAENSDEIIKKAREGNYNVILIDSKIDGLDGYETARIIRKNEADKPLSDRLILIIMVENIDELDRRLWQKAGMNGFIRKPARFTKIRETIQNLAKRQIELKKTLNIQTDGN